MALALGSLTASKIYLGATEINLAYLGATQVYTSSAFSTEAQNYFDRLDTAGDTTYTAYKQPLANYIDSLVALGGAYWDTMESAASFVGVGIQGVTVPLRDGMPTLTNNNFVAGDLNQLTGLKGDKASKYLDTGTIGSDYGQNDCSMSAYMTSPAGITTYVMGAGGSASGSFVMLAISSSLEARSMSSTRKILAGGITTLTGFVGTSRTVSTGYDERANSTSTSETVTSSTPVTSAMSVFAASAALPTDARLATYHAGPALNLATLEGLQETLLSEVAAAKGAAAAANYFARLDTAGDTTYVPYKQPLTNYISSLVALGGAYWDDLESAASFVGVGIQGVTVPLRDGMPTLTNNNFVAGDLNTLTGLKGDASTKYISTGVNATSLSLNDNSISVYLTESRDATNKRYMGNSVSANSIEILANSTGFRSKNFSSQLDINGTSVSSSGIIGISRDNSANYDWRYETSGNVANTSVSIYGGTINVFQSSSTPIAARLATYHAGPALNLATLEALQDTLITEIAATFNTLVYQSDFANGATEYTAVRTTAVAPDSPDASTNVISLTPKVDTANYYIRLTTSNVNTSDTYLTKFDVFIAAGQAFDGIEVKDWIGPIKFAKTLAGSELGQWVSVSFTTTYPDYGQPAIYLTNAGSVSFVGNNSDVAYIRNLEILEQS